ncbi:hypothetical protein EIN_345820 [Entamoeba invadens IP1]|uniref:Uncharacterized protein n=1 Tax=Entamoeba invadens IP1 TaxID=370355 RepID=L7FJG0_ENTIV|nr:hypothetical protein EIN_345820 [Entamoeba invadens IP1]ELP83996.1 hypothetical protein EIN_345820 [Entamoeba invadens IP1]|eukprot:XP_004183342.1 hypothetical protein EIN_345820 [Entamoeba invadens IP1]
MRFCYLPKFLVITFSILVIMGSLIYGMILGAITGYYQMAVAGIYVIAGLIGIFSGLLRGRLTSALSYKKYLLSFVVAWMVSIALNIMGIVKPTQISTFDKEYEFGGIKLSPTFWWYVGGLVFCLLFCTPCLICTLFNCVTVGNYLDYKNDRKKKKASKKELKKKMKPVVQPVAVRPGLEQETELGETKNRKETKKEIDGTKAENFASKNEKSKNNGKKPQKKEKTKKPEEVEMEDQSNDKNDSNEKGKDIEKTKKSNSPSSIEDFSDVLEHHVN